MCSTSNLVYLLLVLLLLTCSNAIRQPNPRIVASAANLRQSKSTSRIREAIFQNPSSDADDKVNTQTIDALNSMLEGDSRRSFAVRVYTILTAQLATTGGVMFLFNLYKPQIFRLMSSQSGPIVYWITFLCSMVSFYGLLLSPTLRTGHLRYPALAAFTVTVSKRPRSAAHTVWTNAALNGQLRRSS